MHTEYCGYEMKSDGDEAYLRILSKPGQHTQFDDVYLLQLLEKPTIQKDSRYNFQSRFGWKWCRLLEVSYC